MSQPSSVSLTEPKVKRCRAPLHQPFPVPLASLTGQPATKDLWQWYHGRLVISRTQGSCSAHVLIESGLEANNVYNNGYFGLMDCKDDRETFNRRNENVKLIQKDWVPGGDFEVLEERDDEVDWLDVDNNEVHVNLGKYQENEVDLTLDDGSSNDEELNTPENVESEPNKCWDDVKKLNPQEQDSLRLELCESFFLSWALGCMLVSINGEEMTISRMWKEFSKLEPDFIWRYSVYHHFRAKGWVVRSGHKFGVDWLLYKHGPQHYHASYSVRVEVANNPASQTSIVPSTWLSLAGLTRVCQTTGKELLVARVKVPPLSEADLSSPDCLKKLSVTEVRVRPWVPSSERWDEKPAVPVAPKNHSGFKTSKGGHQEMESRKRKQPT